MAGTELKASALLTERLKEMTADDAVRMVRQLCVQLEEKKGFHGCIWPGNIRFDEDGKALLGDGSDATAAERSAEQVEFLAPEFFWDDDSSQAADVYSLGLLIYSVCNGGYMPFQPKGGAVTEKDRAAALRKRMKGERIPTPPGMSGQLGDVVRRAMAYKPEQRYATPGELLAALGDTAEALPVPDEAALAAAEAQEKAEEKKKAKKTRKPGKTAGEKEAESKASEAESKKDDPGTPETAEEKKVDAKPADRAADGVKTYEIKKSDEKSGKKGKDKNGGKAAPGKASAAPAEKSGDKKPEEKKADEGFDWSLDEVIALNGLDKQSDDRKPQEKKDAEQGKSGSRTAENQDKKYTVRKDFEGSRRGAPSAAPASRRKRRNSASPAIIVLSLVAVVVIGVVAWQLFAPPQPNQSITPSESTSPLFVMDENGEMQKTDNNINPNSDANADAQGQELTVVSDTVYAADSGVSLRTGPGTSYPVSQTLSRGTELQRTGVIGGWSLVQYGDGEYYVSSALLSLENPLDGEEASAVPSSVEDTDVESKQDTITVASDANLRSGPGTDYDIKGTVKTGAVLQRTGEVNGWSRVLYNGEEVYISNKLIKSAPAAATATSAPTQTPAATAPAATQAPTPTETPAATQAPAPIEDSTDSSDKDLGTIKVTRAVNVRSGPGTDYSILGTAKVGDSFTVSSFIAPKWYQVTYNGQTGYININYVDDSNADVSDVTVTVRVKSAVNIRSGAGADYRIVGTAKTGETFTAVSITDSNWYKIEYNGSTAYVSGKYVTPVT